MYASEDESITNSSFICFQVYILIFSTLAFVCDGSHISVLICFVIESPANLILGPLFLRSALEASLNSLLPSSSFADILFSSSLIKSVFSFKVTLFAFDSLFNHSMSFVFNQISWVNHLISSLSLKVSCLDSLRSLKDASNFLI